MLFDSWTHETLSQKKKTGPKNTNYFSFKRFHLAQTMFILVVNEPGLQTVILQIFLPVQLHFGLHWCNYKTVFDYVLPFYGKHLKPKKIQEWDETMLTDWTNWIIWMSQWTVQHDADQLFFQHEQHCTLE